MAQNTHTIWARARRALRRFSRRQEGAVLVEFALTLPLMLLFFAIIMESGRTFWAYQMVNSGVRDASRYIARAAPRNLCTVVGGSLASYNGVATTIVSNNNAGNGVLPASVTVDSVTATLGCEAGTYRGGTAPIARVQANITVQYPMGFVFDWFGDEVGYAQAIVADESRIFGQ